MQYLFPLLAVFIWAGNTVVNKLAVGIIQPAEIGFFRWLLVGLALTPFMLGPVLRNRRYILANSASSWSSACSAWPSTRAWPTTRRR